MTSERVDVLPSALRSRIVELEGQHKGLVLQNAMLRERPDLPADRIPAAKAYEAEIERLKTALRKAKADGVREAARRADSVLAQQYQHPVRMKTRAEVGGNLLNYATDIEQGKA